MKANFAQSQMNLLVTYHSVESMVSAMLCFVLCFRFCSSNVKIRPKFCVFPMAARLIGARFGEPKIMKAMNIFVWTNDGFQETLVREAQIVVDYYGPGKHERLDVATELGLDRQYSIITALIAEP